jgi:hypothetical protein
MDDLAGTVWLSDNGNATMKIRGEAGYRLGVLVEVHEPHRTTSRRLHRVTLDIAQIQNRIP